MDEDTGATALTNTFLRYALTPSVTPKLHRLLRKHYPDALVLAQFLSTPNAVINTDDIGFNNAANNALGARFKPEVNKRVEQALAWQSQSPRHHIIALHDKHYPTALLATQNAPPVLYAMGNIGILNTPCVAIVGARKASHAALEHAHQIAAELTTAGITVVSGLALGVDAAAHRGSLSSTGFTIAVSATEPTAVYPKSHKALAAQIQHTGVLVTEFALGSQLQPYCFPRRNRIISGLSMGVLVVEAALPSGTLTTAQHALRQGREVMAMPGSINNPLTKGCHDLIKSGAQLVESVEDVLRCLGPELSRHLVDELPADAPQSPPPGLPDTKYSDPHALTVLNCMGFDAASVDTLIQRSGLDAAVVASTLTSLELAGVILCEHGGRFVRHNAVMNRGDKARL
jgi:DNA processing protein